jgi:hypothetical protein
MPAQNSRRLHRSHWAQPPLQSSRCPRCSFFAPKPDTRGQPDSLSCGDFPIGPIVLEPPQFQPKKPRQPRGPAPTSADACRSPLRISIIRSTGDSVKVTLVITESFAPIWSDSSNAEAAASQELRICIASLWDKVRFLRGRREQLRLTMLTEWKKQFR